MQTEFDGWLSQEKGRANRLAKELQIARVNVTRWRRSYVPAQWCAAVEEVTGIPAELLNGNEKWIRVPMPGWPNGRPLAVVAEGKKSM